MEISKSDWKLYRKKVARWQENFMSRLNNEYIALLSADDRIASEKFWELEKRIRSDRRIQESLLKCQNPMLYSI